MTLPLREKSVNTVTYEQLLMGRIQKAIEAKDAGDGLIFDEIIESLEMLLKLKPTLYNELMQFKSGLMNEMQHVLQQVEQLASNARNQIQKRVFLEGEVSVIEWDVRKDYFDKIIEIMGNNQLIPMQVQEPAKITSAEKEYRQEEQRNIQENVNISDANQNTQQNTEARKKPKLSFNKQKFDV